MTLIVFEVGISHHFYRLKIGVQHSRLHQAALRSLAPFQRLPGAAREVGAQTSAPGHCCAICAGEEHQLTDQDQTDGWRRAQVFKSLKFVKKPQSKKCKNFKKLFNGHFLRKNCIDTGVRAHVS